MPGNKGDLIFRRRGKPPIIYWNWPGPFKYRGTSGLPGTSRVGTGPTSDEERTKIDLSTTKLLMTINEFRRRGIDGGCCICKGSAEKARTVRNIQIEMISPVL